MAKSSVIPVQSSIPATISLGQKRSSSDYRTTVEVLGFWNGNVVLRVLESSHLYKEEMGENLQMYLKSETLEIYPVLWS